MMAREVIILFGHLLTSVCTEAACGLLESRDRAVRSVFGWLDRPGDVYAGGGTAQEGRQAPYTDTLTRGIVTTRSDYDAIAHYDCNVALYRV